MPLIFAKVYILILLTGVDYLHAKCNIVHTGVSSTPMIRWLKFHQVES